MKVADALTRMRRRPIGKVNPQSGRSSSCNDFLRHCLWRWRWARWRRFRPMPIAAAASARARRRAAAIMPGRRSARHASTRMRAARSMRATTRDPSSNAVPIVTTILPVRVAVVAPTGKIHPDQWVDQAPARIASARDSIVTTTRLARVVVVGRTGRTHQDRRAAQVQAPIAGRHGPIVTTILPGRVAVVGRTGRTRPGRLAALARARIAGCLRPPCAIRG